MMTMHKVAAAFACIAWLNLAWCIRPDLERGHVMSDVETQQIVAIAAAYNDQTGELKICKGTTQGK